jgi:Ca2+-binding EF-hand superfamily protein
VLEEIIKTEFEMTINIKEMLDKVDDNGDGEIEYKEFKSILDESHKHKMKNARIEPKM